MFRKIVSYLPFSPTLIADLGEYSKKLRRTERIRRFGLFAVVLLIFLHLATIIYPPGVPTQANINKAYNNTALRDLEASMVVNNITQGASDATIQPVQESDRLRYTLSITNRNERPIPATFSVHIDDLLEYTTLTETNGGNVDNLNTLSWESSELQPGETQSRSFSALVNNPIPATSSHGNTSFDCKIEAQFAGNTNSLDVQCPTVKIIEQIISKLPTTSPATSTILLSTLMALSVYLLARSRQMQREIRTIRHNINTEGL